MELKPCPFCGFRRLAIEESHCEYEDDFGAVHSYTIKIKCPSCGASGGGYGTKQDRLVEDVKEKAAEAWNRRANDV